MFVVLKMIFKMSNARATETAESVSLSELSQGKTAILGELHVENSVAEHLMNLGFIPGTEVTAAHSGPGGDPRVYRIERTEVALRRDLADRITVELLPNQKTASSALCDTVLVLGTTDVSAD